MQGAAEATAGEERKRRALKEKELKIARAASQLRRQHLHARMQNYYVSQQNIQADHVIISTEEDIDHLVQFLAAHRTSERQQQRQERDGVDLTTSLALVPILYPSTLATAAPLRATGAVLAHDATQYTRLMEAADFVIVFDDDGEKKRMAEKQAWFDDLLVAAKARANIRQQQQEQPTDSTSHTAKVPLLWVCFDPNNQVGTRVMVRKRRELAAIIVSHVQAEWKQDLIEWVARMQQQRLALNGATDDEEHFLPEGDASIGKRQQLYHASTASGASTGGSEELADSRVIDLTYETDTSEDSKSDKKPNKKRKRVQSNIDAVEDDEEVASTSAMQLRRREPKHEYQPLWLTNRLQLQQEQYLIVSAPPDLGRLHKFLKAHGNCLSRKELRDEAASSKVLFPIVYSNYGSQSNSVHVHDIVRCSSLLAKAKLVILFDDPGPRTSKRQNLFDKLLSGILDKVRERQEDHHHQNGFNVPFFWVCFDPNNQAGQAVVPKKNVLAAIVITEIHDPWQNRKLPEWIKGMQRWRQQTQRTMLGMKGREQGHGIVVAAHGTAISAGGAATSAKDALTEAKCEEENHALLTNSDRTAFIRTISGNTREVVDRNGDSATGLAGEDSQLIEQAEEKPYPFLSPPRHTHLLGFISAHENASKKRRKQAAKEEFAFENVLKPILLPNLMADTDSIDYLIREARALMENAAYIIILRNVEKPSRSREIFQKQLIEETAQLNEISRGRVKYCFFVDRTNCIGRAVKQKRKELAAVVVTKIRPEWQNNLPTGDWMMDGTADSQQHEKQALHIEQQRQTEASFGAIHDSISISASNAEGDAPLSIITRKRLESSESQFRDAPLELVAEDMQHNSAVTRNPAQNYPLHYSQITSNEACSQLHTTSTQGIRSTASAELSRVSFSQSTNDSLLSMRDTQCNDTRSANEDTAPSRIDESIVSSNLSGSTIKTQMLLEEELMTYEATVGLLKARKEQVDTALADKLGERSIVREDVNRLEARVKDLQALRTIQQDLCRQLASNLARMEATLTKLMSETTVAELSDDDLAIFHAVNENAHADLVASNVDVLTETEENSMQNSQDARSMSGAEDNSQVDDGAFASLCQHLRHPVLSTNDLQRLWLLGTHVDKLITFLPCLPAETVHTILKFSSTEGRSSNVDQMTRERRHALCFTCLDFRAMADIRKAKVCLSHELSRDERSKQFDPQVAICPYELGGKCSDRFCPYQHLQQREQGSLLPRELLPLPVRFSEPKPPELKRGKDIGSKSIMLSLEGANKPLTCIDVYSKENVRAQPDAFSEEDFVVLPTPDSSDYSSDEASRSDREERQSLRSFVGTKQRSSAVVSLSFTSIVDTLSSSLNDSQGQRPSEICGFFLGVMNCIRVAVHAGRFDACDELMRVCKEKIQFHFEMDEGENLFRDILLRLTEFVSHAVHCSFALTSVDNTDIFSMLFDVQHSSTMVVMFLQQFRKNLLTQSRYPCDLRVWHAGAKSICSSFRNCMQQFPCMLREAQCVDGELGVDINGPIARLHEIMLEVCTTTAHDSLTRLMKKAWHQASLLFRYLRKVDSEKCGIAEHEIFKVLKSLRDCGESFSELLVAPLFAATISLCCSMRQYAQAHQRLEALVMDAKRNGLMPLSELLWCQLVQLRVTFPPSSTQSKTILRLFDEYNILLVNKIECLGIYLHRVVLGGDWNLVRHLNEQPTNPSRFEACQKLVLAACRYNEADSSLAVDLDGVSMRTRCPDSGLDARFPMSLVLAGPHITSLSLNFCEIIALPDGFGSAFPELQSLSLNNNNLIVLPPSLHKMKRLKQLRVTSNRLDCLPSNFTFPELEELLASQNKLTSLPESLSACKRLQVLHLDGNGLNEKLLLNLLSELPELRLVSPSIEFQQRLDGNCSAAK
ncbi:hypothetical protein MPSEU_000815300 [Mayamaea pseudoterrestris]|nr:hypothetical protein MPSEU_000815300 [Mayamaea pseudoterrestris]